MTDHGRIEELLAVRALGGLDAAEAEELDRALTAHGASCAECARLRSESEEVAGRLAFALAPDRVREDLEDEIAARALAERPPGSPAAGVRDPGTIPSLAEGRRSRGAGTGWRAVVAIAAALVLFAGGWIVGAALRAETPIDLRSARIVDLESDTGSLSVAFEPGEPGVLILGSGLPAPDEGKVYEVWMIEGEAPTSGGCLVPTSDGSIVELLDADPGSADTIAVTVESAGCPDAPTTDPIAVARLA